MAECMTPGVEAEDFAFQHSSPLSLRRPSAFSSPPAPPLQDTDVDAFHYEGHNTSAAKDRVIRPSESITRHDDLNDLPDDRRVSGHSSISSFPASVLHHDPERTPSRSTEHIRHDSFSKTPSPRRHRGLASAFRNPSSVLDMQLNDDTGDDTESVMSHHRRSGSRLSVRSHGSNQSSPSKRGSRSLHSSPKKSSGLRKEFPLVLLHCTLLPPSNNWLAPTCDYDLFAALLPDGYRQRWIQLQDKLSSSEVKSRGILLPHPQEDYELLEERLLEALELETPRIQGTHFKDKGADSGFESGSQTESDLDADDKCPDCGKHLQREHKWEIRVFAANGLMRGAAWSAAWRDMEKVDVEIGLWMPEDVRREVNSRLEALRAAEQEAQMEEAASAFSPETHTHDIPDDQHSRDTQYEHQDAPPTMHSTPVTSASRSSPLDLLMQDPRNAAILLLSLVIAAYAILAAKPWAATIHEEPALQVLMADTSIVTSTEVWTTTVVAHEASPSAAFVAHASTVEVSQAVEPAEPPQIREPISQEAPKLSASSIQEVDTASTDAAGDQVAPTQYETLAEPARIHDTVAQKQMEDFVQDAPDSTALVT